MELILISLYLAASLIMGAFSVSQMQYQHRIGGITEVFRAMITFVKGFIGWPIYLPLGIKRGKYRMNVFHKVGNTNENI